MTPDQKQKARAIRRRLRELERDRRDQERRAMAQDRRGEVSGQGVVVRADQVSGEIGGDR